MLISELMWIKRRRLLAATVTCMVLIAGLTILWQMGQVAEAAILDPHPGLVGWWRFDEGEGGVAEDSSGYGNHGTIYGATWVEGKHGKALSFDGTNDYVDCGRAIKFNGGSFTVGSWSKIDVLPGTKAAHEVIVSRIFDTGTPAGRGWYLSYDQWTNKIRGWLYDGVNPPFDIYSDSAVSINTWYHALLVYNQTAGKLNLYVNGVKQADEATVTQSTDPTSAYTLRIGSHSQAVQFLDGVIDEVRIYNRALSAAEIQEIFEKGPLSSRLLAKVPRGTTQFIVTLSWQGVGNINVTIERSPSEIYTEDMVPVYEKIVYSTSGGIYDMLNIKRLAVSVTALSSDENWYIMLEFDHVEDYRITVEVQR